MAVASVTASSQSGARLAADVAAPGAVAGAVQRRRNVGDGDLDVGVSGAGFLVPVEPRGSPQSSGADSARWRLHRSGGTAAGLPRWLGVDQHWWQRHRDDPVGGDDGAAAALNASAARRRRWRHLHCGAVATVNSGCFASPTQVALFCVARAAHGRCRRHRIYHLDAAGSGAVGSLAASPTSIHHPWRRCASISFHVEIHHINYEPHISISHLHLHFIYIFHNTLALFETEKSIRFKFQRKLSPLFFKLNSTLIYPLHCLLIITIYIRSCLLFYVHHT